MGILVHSGSADSGHYHSFIKERTPDNHRNDRWFRFNDTQVSAFNINTIKEECFVGNQMVPYQVGYHTSYKEQIRMLNAYMLFYEKIGAHKNVQPTPSIHKLLWKQKLTWVLWSLCSTVLWQTHWAAMCRTTVIMKKRSLDRSGYADVDKSHHLHYG